MCRHLSAIMQTLSFDVAGMTCGGRTGSVQRTLSQLSGISQAAVTLTPGVATVVAELTLVTSAQIESAITGLGYPPRFARRAISGCAVYCRRPLAVTRVVTREQNAVAVEAELHPILNQARNARGRARRVLYVAAPRLAAGGSALAGASLETLRGWRSCG